MLEMARIVAIHPEDHSIDCVILRTGQRCTGVPVLSAGASTTTGSSNLPPITAPNGDERWNIPARGANDAIAVLAPTFGGHWICIGNKFPEVNAVLNAEAGRQVVRHSSGAWSMIAPDGTVTMGHPSGAVMTMGSNLTPTDPVGGDVDGQWQHSGPNASAQVGLKVVLPSGAVITVETDGKAKMTFPAEIEFEVPLAKFSNNVQVGGNVVVTGSLTAASVSAGGIGLTTHHHTGVATGSGNSGAPSP